MIKTWFKEYEKIKDKAVVVYPYEWDCMSEKQRNKILSTYPQFARMFHR